MTIPNLAENFQRNDTFNAIHKLFIACLHKIHKIFYQSLGNKFLHWSL